MGSKPSSTTAPLPVANLNKADETALPEDDRASYLSSCISVAESTLDFRKIHTRTYQVSRTTEYWQPNDAQQNDSLELAHYFLYIFFEGLYFAPVLGHARRVLDIGTGTGSWAIDFADHFPDARVTGTDISPIQPAFLPPNLDIIIDDAQESWPFEANTFDYIYIRNLHGSISDWKRLHKQAFRALQPGAYLEHVEMGMTIRTFQSLDESHIFNRWAAELHDAADEWGRQLAIAEDGSMKRYMSDAGFLEVVERRFDIPIGGWAETPRLKKVGQCALEFWRQSLEGFSLFFLKQVQGWEYDRIQTFVREMSAALGEEELNPYFQVTVVFGRTPGV